MHIVHPNQTFVKTQRQSNWISSLSESIRGYCRSYEASWKQQQRHCLHWQRTQSAQQATQTSSSKPQHRTYFAVHIKPDMLPCSTSTHPNAQASSRHAVCTHVNTTRFGGPALLPALLANSLGVCRQPGLSPKPLYATHAS
jgi:hypothetical protein